MSFSHLENISLGARRVCDSNSYQPSHNGLITHCSLVQHAPLGHLLERHIGIPEGPVDELLAVA